MSNSSGGSNGKFNVPLFSLSGASLSPSAKMSNSNSSKNTRSTSTSIANSSSSITSIAGNSPNKKMSSTNSICNNYGNFNSGANSQIHAHHCAPSFTVRSVHLFFCAIVTFSVLLVVFVFAFSARLKLVEREMIDPARIRFPSKSETNISSVSDRFEAARVNSSELFKNYRKPGFEPANLPIFAFSITGSSGDVGRIKRLLLSLYHPRNEYLIHLDSSAQESEKEELQRFIESGNTFREAGNVRVNSYSNLVTYRGITMLTTYLHQSSVLLKMRNDFDWFINLSASDYPLVTPDDLLYVFSFLPREFNFVQHTSNLGWKAYQRSRPIVVDPGTFLSKKQDLIYTSQRRPLPDSFELFEGSAWVVLSRPFVEYTLLGIDNLPRLLLVYFSNYVSSPEWYFHTLICNSPFKETIINSDLHYIRWHHPARQHPMTLGPSHFDNMTVSGLPFARKFPRTGPILNQIDRKILHRLRDRFTPGGWCNQDSNVRPGLTQELLNARGDPCAVIGDVSKLVPSPAADRLKSFMELALEAKFISKQCV